MSLKVMSMVDMDCAHVLVQLKLHWIKFSHSWKQRSFWRSRDLVELSDKINGPKILIKSVVKRVESEVHKEQRKVLVGVSAGTPNKQKV